MSRTMRSLFTIFLVSLLASCFSAYTESEIDEYLQPYLYALDAGIYKPERVLYSQSFGRKLEGEEWKKAIEKTWEQQGKIKAMKLTSWTTNKFITIGGSSGIRYFANYRVERKAGTTHETIMLFESSRSEENPKITGHIITTEVKF